jgi:hypothetical protein
MLTIPKGKKKHDTAHQILNPGELHVPTFLHCSRQYGSMKSTVRQQLHIGWFAMSINKTPKTTKLNTDRNSLFQLRLQNDPKDYRHIGNNCSQTPL